MGAIVRINLELCNKCLLCVELCPAGAFGLRDNEVVAYSDKCVECYGCIPLCPEGAISVEPA